MAAPTGPRLASPHDALAGWAPSPEMLQRGGFEVPCIEIGQGRSRWGERRLLFSMSGDQRWRAALVDVVG